ncbi:unnamed protein product [Rhizophagus irregularis]|nr:unnamed protein product [Rhizophagus irregularis]
MISGFPGLLNDGREEEIYILREIMLDFIKVMDQKSQVLIGKKVTKDRMIGRITEGISIKKDWHAIVKLV